MDDLVAFIKARLDEDERVARAVTPDDWGNGDGGINLEWEDLPDTAFSHAKQHDPDRVLRGVEAKRGIVAEHSTPWTAAYEGTVCDVCTFGWPCKTMRLLASEWSDHKDHRQEWKP